MNDGQGNWNKLYRPGKETPLSLLRFSPHDEEAGATELKKVSPRARQRKKITSADASRALVAGGR